MHCHWHHLDWDKWVISYHAWTSSKGGSRSTWWLHVGSLGVPAPWEQMYWKLSWFFHFWNPPGLVVLIFWQQNGEWEDPKNETGNNSPAVISVDSIFAHFQDRYSPVNLGARALWWKVNGLTYVACPDLMYSNITTVPLYWKERSSGMEKPQ